MQSPSFATSSSELGQFLVRRFPTGRLLLVGADANDFPAAVEGKGMELTHCEGVAEMRTWHGNGGLARFDLALWVYPAEVKNDLEVLACLTNMTDELILLPAVGAELIERRPALVGSLAELDFLPQYDSEVMEIEPSAVHLQRSRSAALETFLPEAERGFARINSQLRGLQRTLRTRMAELEAADRHIASLEQKLLKLKEYRRSIRQLKEEKQLLRKSPERKIGQVLLAPYRLPQRLIHGLRKHWPVGKAAGTTEYEEWFERHRLQAGDAERLRAEIEGFSHRPCVSIVTPVFNTPLPWLHEMVDSVRRQVYENWELILSDDKSTDPSLLALLDELAEKDPRIIVSHIDRHGGISAASNRAIELASGEWIGFLDHDDFLEPDALFQEIKLLQLHPEADLIYSDEDKLTEAGLDSPIMKPDWSPDFFFACNYICHFTIIRRSMLDQIGGFRSEYDGAQDYDLFFRVIERTSRIFHVPRVLYHWRRSDVSTADSIRRKPGSLDTGRLAVEAHLKRTGKPGHVAVDWRTHAYWIKRDIPEARKISIIIPVRDRIDLLKRCIASLVTRTRYEPYEIVVVDNDSSSEEARAYFASFKHRLLHFSGPFNYSAINNFAVQQTDSPWLLFLNNDTEAIEPGWLHAMAEQVQRPEIGAVGARLLFPDDTVQHAGIVVGVGGVAEHAFRGFPAEAPGVCRQLQVTRNYSAVTGACLLTRREVFQEVGGFDEEQLPVTFSDVDLCLKMRRAGYLIVYTPYAKLYHHESASRRRSVEPLETGVMQERWSEVLANDPYYNPNLSRERADFSLGE